MERLPYRVVDNRYIYYDYRGVLVDCQRLSVVLELALVTEPLRERR